MERQATASLIAHLAELEARNLHLASGFRSIFGYCRHVLHCSEHEAYNRMEVVHVARRFPVILPLLAEGLLHLTAVRLLAPHLRDEDHLALLGGALHRSRRDVLKLVARWFPSADVPSSLRKLPASAATIHGPWPGDAAAIVARALKLLRAEAEKKAFSATSRPRPPQPAAPGSRNIPADVQRAVWERDEGQCAFEGHGRRCEERSFLEFHHVAPWAAGGVPSRENIALRCRAHNAYEAAAYFGPIRAALGAGVTAPDP